jgi:hypothetical protein
MDGDEQGCDRKHALYYPPNAATLRVVTPEERAVLCDRLRSSRDALRETIGVLTEEEWCRKPALDAWSPAQCAQHIIRVEADTFDKLRETIRTAQPGPQPGTEGKDKLLIRAMPNRTRKVPAPEWADTRSLTPQRDVVLAEFGRVRGALISYVETTTGDLRQYGFPHFVLGPLDGYQWLLAMALHCERHTAQIKESLARAGTDAS